MVAVKPVIKGIDAVYVTLAAERINLDPKTYVELIVKKHFKDYPFDPPEWLIKERIKNYEPNITTDAYEQNLVKSFIEYHERLKNYRAGPDSVGSSFRKDQVPNNKSRS